MRIAICTNFVSPYRAPVFAELARQTGFAVRVLTSTGMERDRDWTPCHDPGCHYEIVQSLSITRLRTQRSAGDSGFEQTLERHYPIGLVTDLLRYRPDVIISGELGPRTLIATVAGRLTGAPVIPWTYHPTAQSTVAESGAGLKKMLAKYAPAVIGMGTQAREVLTRMGCHRDRIFDAWNAADSASVTRRQNCDQHRISVSAIRERVGGKRLAVVAGRLVEMKGIKELLRAWSQLPTCIRAGWELVFIGSGPLKSLIDTWDDPSVRSIGSVSPEHMVDWYTAADLHIFASLGDPWGLVVNEAMQCGTPTLCSVRAGCADDLVHDRCNGLLFDPMAPTDRVARSLIQALSHPCLEQLGSAAKLDIARVTPNSMASGMAAAIRFVMGERSQKQERTAA